MSKPRTYLSDQFGPLPARRRWWSLALTIVASWLLGTVVIPSNVLIIILLVGGYKNLQRFTQHSMDELLEMALHGGVALLPVVLILALFHILLREEHPLRRLGWGLSTGAILVFGSFLLWAATLFRDEYEYILNHPILYFYILLLVSPAGAVASAVFYLEKMFQKTHVSRDQRLNIH
jgi:hypothetical protein